MLDYFCAGLFRVVLGDGGAEFVVVEVVFFC